jgi:hypothetical protein
MRKKNYSQGSEKRLPESLEGFLNEFFPAEGRFKRYSRVRNTRGNLQTNQE